MKQALKAKDLEQIAVVQAMLESAQKTIDEEAETRREQHAVAVSLCFYALHKWLVSYCCCGQR